MPVRMAAFTVSEVAVRVPPPLLAQRSGAGAVLPSPRQDSQGVRRPAKPGKSVVVLVVFR